MTDRVWDATTITVSTICLAVLGGGGAAVFRIAVFPPGELWFGDPELLGWMIWIAQLTGKLPGLLVGGVLLGRWLRRVSPWTVFGWISAYMCVVCILATCFDNEDRIALVGFTFASLQQMISLLGSIGGVAFGIWFGTKIKETYFYRASSNYPTQS